MSHPVPATLYRIAALAGCGSAVVLLINAAKRAETPEQRRATLERWQAEGRARGHKPGWAAAKFKAVYGSWPAR